MASPAGAASALLTTGLTNAGRTTHYQFQYVASLSLTPEPARTNAVIAACENDFQLMAGWFNNLALDVTGPIAVNVTAQGGGGSWSISNGVLTVTINPGSGDAT